MKLSVIIPTYNRASHLAANVASVLESVPEETEVIVVDDGSSDNTADIASMLGPAVRYLRQNNAGPAAARNTGFAASCGEFIAFLDSDDHWIAGSVTRLIGVLEHQPNLGLIFGDALMGTDEANSVSVATTFGGEAFASLPGQQLEPHVKQLNRQAFFRLITRRNIVFLGSLILRRQVVETSGGFEPTLFGSEDWHFMMRLAIRHEYAYYQDLPTAFYFQHPGGISRNLDRMELEFTKALQHLATEPYLAADDMNWVNGQMARQMFAYAYIAYDRGDLKAARERFTQCLKTHPSPTNLGYWAVSHVPPGALGTVRRWKRRFER